MGDTSQPQAQPQKFPLTLSVPQVNKEIVSGLKCLHHTYRHGLRGEGGVLGARGGGGTWGRAEGSPQCARSPAVDKAVYMVGSYGPSAQEYEFVTPVEEAPRGALVRGAYVVTSFFTDDDRTAHLSWEWGLHVCQDWER